MRYWEIDFLKGIGIIGMILFHIHFMLNWPAPPSTFDFLISWPFRPLFICGAGVTAFISYTKHKDYKRFLKRSLRFLPFLFVLIAMNLFLNRPLVFDIFFFFFTANLIAYPFLTLSDRPLLPLIGILFIFATLFYGYVDESEAGFVMGDFSEKNAVLGKYTIVPWFGFFLIGSWAGTKLYDKDGRLFDENRLRVKKDWMITKVVTWVGERSLIIFLLSWPMLYAILYVLGVPHIVAEIDNIIAMFI
jgi:uncharacterized membrane protein